MRWWWRMAVTTVTAGYTLIGFPACDEFSPDKITATDDATRPSDYEERDFEMAPPAPGDSNSLDGNGKASARFLVTGEPTSRTTLDVTIDQTGYPDGTALFYYSDDDGTTYIGQTSPIVPRGIETIFYSASAGDGYRNPRGVDLDDGTAGWVVEDWANDDVIFRKRDANGAFTTAGVVTSLSTAFASSDLPSPDVVRIPESGRLVCALMEHSGTSAYINLYSSDDDGVTWLTMARHGLTLSTSTYTWSQLRIAYDEVSQNYILAVYRTDGAMDYAGEIYVSTTSGVTWTSVKTVTGARAHDLIAEYGNIVYLMVDNNGDLDTYRSAAGVEWVQWYEDRSSPIRISSNTNKPFASALLPNGWIIIFGKGTSSGTINYAVSADVGRTWGTLDGSYPYNDNFVTSIGGDNSGINYTGAVWHDGSIFLYGTAGAGTLANASMAWRFGLLDSITEEEPYNLTHYWPVDVPRTKDSTNYNAFAGAGTESITSDASGRAVYQIATTAAQAGYTSYNGLSASNNKVRLWMRMQPVSGGSVANDSMVVELTEGFGATEFTCQLRFSTTQVQMHDLASATDLLASPVTLPTAPFDIIFHLDADNAIASAWIKASTSNEWSVIGVNKTITSDSNVTDRFRAGTLTIGTAATMQFLGWAIGGVEGSLAAGFTAPDDTIGMWLTTVPMRLPNGVYSFGRGGPFSASDTFECSSISRYPVGNAFDIDNAPSPRLCYKSAEGTTGRTSFAYFDQGADYDGTLGPGVGVAALNVYARSVTLQKYSGGRNDVVHLDLRQADIFGSQPGFTRGGTTSVTIIPNGTNGNPKFYRKDELKGTYIEISDGIDTVVAEVLGNTAGQFSNATGVMPMYINCSQTPLSGSWSSLPASLAQTAGSTINLYWHDGIAVGRQTSDADRWYAVEWVRYSWDNEEKLGKVIPFTFEFLMKEPAVGRQFETFANDEVTALPYGFKRGRRLAPPGRRVRLPFSQTLLNQSRYQGGTALNTFGPSTTARGIWEASLDHAQAALEQYGSYRPIILATGLTFSADLTSTATFYGKDLWIYGRIENSITATMGMGQRYGYTTGTHSADFDITVVEEV